ncbi:MAG: hypothetical protein M3Q07_11875, partial [Pseudobdellovibrionaceae bacterium]|nr:hypothetical protein [Pseudobdellovibrionaceae bacterium]
MGKLLFLVAIWLTASQAKGDAAMGFPVVDLAEVNDNDGLFLGQRLVIWENQNAPVGPASMMAGEFDSKFQPSLKDFPGPAYVKGELWLRVVIHNPESFPQSLVLESRYALTDYISLFQKDLNGLVRGEDHGDRNQVRPDHYAFRSPAFSIMAYP